MIVVVEIGLTVQDRGWYLKGAFFEHIWLIVTRHIFGKNLFEKL